MITRRAVFLAGLASAALAPLAGAAQQLGLAQSPILTIESDRFFAESQFGRRIAAEIEAESIVLSAENRRIEAELMAEERDLTERRASMDPEAFRALADGFDARVQEIRRTQDAKARALNQRRDASRVAFLQAAVPVLETLMREAGAGVVLERASVFISANATDITDEAVARIDAAIGDGQQLEQSGD
jgi:Skp family chaperone for outer membrane proteins